MLNPSISRVLFLAITTRISDAPKEMKHSLGDHQSTREAELFQLHFSCFQSLALGYADGHGDD